MNRPHAAILLSVLLLTALAGCADKPAAAQGTAAGKPTATQAATGKSTATQSAAGKSPVIQVATAAEFVAAIGPNRTLELAPGDYDLTGVKDRKMDYVRWDKNFDGLTLTIRNLEGLKIVGRDAKPAHLIVHPRYVYVLNFENCKDVELAHLVLGHSPDEGYCDSGVLGATDCQRIHITDCDLFGCGTEGLTLKKVRSFTMDGSVVRDCSFGILTAEGCTDLRFSQTRFTGNREFYGVTLHDTEKVLFDKCIFSGNSAGEALFTAISCTGIVVRECIFTDNRFKQLTNNSAAVKFENAESAPAAGKTQNTPTGTRR
jgi:hypothetical protein